MDQLIFMCHSSNDSDLAMKIVSYLEQEDIHCWIAPRNIPLGENYQASIIRGIRKSTMMIVVFTASANDSDAVVYEIEKAHSQKMPIIPFKAENIEYSDSLEYFLRSKQATMAYKSTIDAAISELLQFLKRNYRQESKNLNPDRQPRTEDKPNLTEKKVTATLTKETRPPASEPATPEGFYYTKDHEWIVLKGDTATIGVTDFAQRELGEVVYIEVNKIGNTLAAGEVFGTIEAVKTVSDLFLPLSGTIIEFNQTLIDSPELINNDPYGKGWIIKMAVSHPDQVRALLSAKAYQKFID